MTKVSVEFARNWVAERAAILEYDAGMRRSDAERKAREMWRDFAQLCGYEVARDDESLTPANRSQPPGQG